MDAVSLAGSLTISTSCVGSPDETHHWCLFAPNGIEYECCWCGMTDEKDHRTERKSKTGERIKG